MIDPAYCRLMAAYNRWMNGKIYTLCATLDEAERRRDRGAYFGSIEHTLDHIWWGDAAWLARFTGASFERAAVGELNFADFCALRAARVDMDQRIEAWAQGVSEQWLASELVWHSGMDQRTRRQPAWIAAVHLFNHQTHHRGQVTTLLSQLELDAGVTDLPRMPGLTEY